VAVKFIYEKNRGKRSELLREAQTQAKMRAGCIPQVFDAFEWRQSVCMVMEWIRGVSLEVLLEEALSAEQRVAVAWSLLRALAEIHRQGFAHRDLKPENVIVTPDRGLFLVDFGFSKNIADVQTSSASTVKGTPAYMAPELWSHGSQVDLMRADVYAVGKILLQLLSDTPHSKFTGTLLENDPLKRPASGSELLTLWENEGTSFTEVTDWNGMAGDLTAEQLSLELLGSAKKLLYANRTDEAYWLLVESLEENGNNREALELMESFRHQSRRRPVLLQNALFLALLVTGVLIAFFAGTKSGGSVRPTGVPLRKERSPLLSSELTGPAAIGNVALREDTLRTDRLSGRLVVRNVPQGAVLSIDSRVFDPDSIRSGYYLHWGEHSVMASDSSGKLISRNNVNLLPFQTKAVELSPPDKKKKGT
jgi:serine/threonine protein kinase